MSIISSYEGNYSSTLAKRFAALTVSYVNNPEEAQSRKAKVPIANAFRMLDMFKYDAFDDEERRGVLAFEGEGHVVHSLATSALWHSAIKEALDSALATAFDNQLSKEAAIDELQIGLRALASNEHIDDQIADKVRTFFTRLQAALA